MSSAPFYKVAGQYGGMDAIHDGVLTADLIRRNMAALSGRYA